MIDNLEVRRVNNGGKIDAVEHFMKYSFDVLSKCFVYLFNL